MLTGFRQASDSHPRIVDRRHFAKFQYCNIVVKCTQPKVRMPVNFGYVMYGFATSVRLSIVFSYGYGEIFDVNTKNKQGNNNL